MSAPRKTTTKNASTKSNSTGGGGLGPNATLVATSQVSRFHNETLSTLSNDVDLKQVHIAIGPRILLDSANLRLFRGVHYGLIGQNGVGKSTLLKCIGYNQLAGFPSNVRVLYVEQLEGAVFDMVVAGRKAGDDVAIMMVEAEATDKVIELIAGGAGAGYV